MRAARSGISIFKVAVLYVGSVIGAGFASGQEILQFFIVFGWDGFFGALLAGFLFVLLGGMVMYQSVTLGSANYSEVYRAIMGRLPAKVMDWFSLVMLPGGVMVMLAGGGAVFSEHLGLPSFMGTLATALVTILVTCMGLRGVISSNALLVPMKVGAILFICLLVLFLSHPAESSGTHLNLSYGSRVNWAWSSLLYVSYNMVVPAAVLSSLGRTVSLREGVMGGIVGGAVLGVAALLIVVTGLTFYPHILAYEVPLLYIAGTLGETLRVILGVFIWIAILTTAIANTHGFASRLAGSHSSRYKLLGTGLVLFALPLSALKFSLLIKVLYPLFGYAGLLLLVALLVMPTIQFFKKRRM